MQYTTYYELPQYEANDKTAWLTTFNQAMLAIDTGIHAAKAAADSAGTAASSASSVASQASLDVATLTNSLNTVIGNINTINSLIGNGTPTTTDHTLIGAINELHANQGDLANLATTAKNSLVAAINELAGGGGAAVELQSGTLTAGQTSVVLTFADQTISATSLIDVYVEDGINYTAIATTATTVTLTFEAQASNKAVAVRVTN